MQIILFILAIWPFALSCGEPKGSVSNRRLDAKQTATKTQTAGDATKEIISESKETPIPSTKISNPIEEMKTVWPDSPSEVSEPEAEVAEPAGPSEFRLSFSEFSACAPADFGDSSRIHIDISKCLFEREIVTLEIKMNLRSAITDCVTAGQNKNPQILAMCLSKHNFIIEGYRDPYQADIDQCVEGTDVSVLKNCLKNKGILPPGVTQAVLNACGADTGTGNIEQCLRKGGFIERKTALLQYDISLCQSITGPQDSIYNCLLQNGLIPLNPSGMPVFSSSDIESCITTDGISNVSKCLRMRRTLIKSLNDTHVGRCIKIVGLSKVAQCLDENGLSPITAVTLEPRIEQSNIDVCVASYGREGIMKCLRDSRLGLPKVLTLDDFNECRLHSSPDTLFQCLSREGNLPIDVTLTNFKDCVTETATNPQLNLITCLRRDKHLPAALIQADIDSCIYNVSSNSKLAACLNSNIYHINAPILQGDIDKCLGKVGVTDLARCLQMKSTPAALLVSVLPTELTQEHVRACAADYRSLGEGLSGGMRNCFSDNGFLPPVVIAGGSVLNERYVRTCIETSGLQNLAKCLRLTGPGTKTPALLSAITQTVLNDCYTLSGGGIAEAIVGPAILSCLVDSGFPESNVVVAGSPAVKLVSADIATCFKNAVGADGPAKAAGIYSCLKLASKLP